MLILSQLAINALNIQAKVNSKCLKGRRAPSCIVLYCMCICTVFVVCVACGIVK